MLSPVVMNHESIFVGVSVTNRAR